MSILKMKFVSIVGAKDRFDDFIAKYIIDSGIQLENALNFLENIKGLSPYTDENPYSDLLKKCTAIIASMGLEKEAAEAARNHNDFIVSAADIRERVAVLEKSLQECTEKRDRLKEELNKCTHMQKQLELLIGLDVDIDSFFNFEFIKFRFGRMPKKSYRQLQLYIEELDAIVIPVSQDQDYMWLVYFTPRTYGEKVDGIFSSLYFERIRISGELQGTPAQAYQQLKDKIEHLEDELKKSEKDLEDFYNSAKCEAIRLYLSSTRLNRISEVRKSAAHTKESFYIIGWMPEEDFRKLEPVLNEEKDIILIQQEPEVVKSIKPPTELRNNRIFKPFETLVRMYGLPSYNETDPTAFVAITYFLMFGLMFGDVGQGAVLLAGGILLMKLKVALGGVIIGAGMSSILFGFLYGSVFGFEDWIPHLWMNPMGNINTMLIVGVAAGVLFITVAMILNIKNGIKGKDLARIFFDRNGVAGFIFYWGVVLLALYVYRTGKLTVSPWIILPIVVLPILAMFLKEPLENLIHKRKFLPPNKGVFFVQSFFELFDTILSFISNTISFIRLSAFALNHAGLFMAVLILAEMASGFGSVVAIVVGNILIIGLEGLIVGIQALRLEYYELFSRFFTGDGKPYKPLKNQYFS